MRNNEQTRSLLSFADYFRLPLNGLALVAHAFIFVFVISRFNFYKCYIMYTSLLSGQAPVMTF
jgi:hypothetical protein